MVLYRIDHRGALALADAIHSIPAKDALVGFVSSVSVGIYRGTPVLDLDYAEIPMPKQT